MALRRGHKHSLETFLDNGKFHLLEQCAQDRGVRTTAFAKDAVHEWLSKNVESELI